MIKSEGLLRRELRVEEIGTDFVVIGGGLAGVCAAISAAREGIKVVLVQDRPVLGGNASSEVRLWVLGATSHMGNNNRWAREGGVINEILEENLFRNRQGNPLILDTILLEKVIEEENITLLLNTAVYDLEKVAPDTISAVNAFCSQNSTRYLLRAPRFCDASGDGVVGFMSGAAFRMGAESNDEFGELFAPDDSCGELLGHSLYFYSKDVGTPVEYKSPSWALKDIAAIPRYRQFNANMQGCNLWWIEYGGRLDTVHQSEEIKWELWKVVYGVWDYIKNSGNFPESKTMTLEWVGHVPGKRESRRFEGDYILRQQDVVDQIEFPDVMAHGGWAVDLHPADGVYSEKPACTQWHSKGVYGIPYRCFYSRNISNLFLAGRIISATHVAFGSTRVMATCGAGGQGVGVAAAVCKELQCVPRELSTGEGLKALQVRLDRRGQYLPGIEIKDPIDLVATAKPSASSSLKLAELKMGEEWAPLDDSRAMLLPLGEGAHASFMFEIDAADPGALMVELCRSVKPGNFTPDELVESIEIPFVGGCSEIVAEFQGATDRAGYYFVKLCENPAVRVRMSDDRLTGVLAVSNAFKKAVATSSEQQPPEGIGIDRFEFWLPGRRPAGRNIGVKISPAIELFGPENVISGPSRPTDAPNAWVADPEDEKPELRLEWREEVGISKVLIDFDPDWDHPMESVLMSHPEEVVPFTVKDFDLVDASGRVVKEIRNHHGAQFELLLDSPLSTRSLSLRVRATHGAPAAIFRIRVFGESGEGVVGRC